MTHSRRTATIIIHREGELESKSLRLPIWLLRASPRDNRELIKVLDELSGLS